MGAVWGVLGFIVFLAIGIAQLVAGYAGIAHHLGDFWAVLAVIAALAFRFTLPITIGSFFGAMNVWGWHWIFAAIFAAPGLLLIVPGVIGNLFSLIKQR